VGRRLRILVYSPFFWPSEKGGAERSARILCHDLAANGHDVTVVKVRPPGTEVSYTDGAVQVVTIPIRMGSLPVELGSRSTPARLLWHAMDILDVPRLRALSEILGKAPYDVFHSQSVTGLSAAGWRLASRAGAAVVHTARDYNLLCPPGNLFRDGQRCVRRCRRCVTLSEPKRLLERYLDHAVGISNHVLDHHRAEGHFTNVEATVVPNAVETHGSDSSDWWIR
jgi:glycosyltransferase involved in cell wall biosynthesis